MGTSKLGVFSRLKTSRVYFNENRSVNDVIFTIEMSAFFCQDCRKMLRWPLVKPVSKLSPGAMPFVALGVKSGTVKQEALRAGWPGVLPTAPVIAFWGVQ